MHEYTIKAPAKINIGLNIISKRPDGYHNIETIFYPVSLYDTLSFLPSDKLTFSTTSEKLAKEPDNLILKAVKLLEQYTGEKFLLDIKHKKNIPIGAGLGGGSSDAAATLLAVNEIYKLRIPVEELGILAGKLGSDAPFFLRNKPSFASSRGEVLREIDFNIPYPILLVNPGIHISTKWAYENITPKPISKSLLSHINNKIEVKDYKYLFYNDFEDVIFRKFEELKEIKKTMYSMDALFSLMTGSGSTIFGIYPDMDKIKKAEGHFNKLNYFTFIHKN
ncbi:MAG: 4-(cytidine 5'-diphospho)-2-C-methyl-D-erythritol kinase [Ignavibacteriaceae bacterium]